MEISVERIYENFFMRDLTYIFGGFLILVSLEYAFGVDVFGYLVNFLKIWNWEWFKLIVILVVSYFTGLIAKEGFTLLDSRDSPPKHWFSTKTPYGNDYFKKMKKFVTKYEPLQAKKELARIDYFRHIGASIGIASFISFWILIWRLIFSTEFFISKSDCFASLNKDLCEYTVFIIIMFIISIIGYLENRWKNDELDKFLQ